MSNEQPIDIAAELAALRKQVERVDSHTLWGMMSRSWGQVARAYGALTRKAGPIGDKAKRVARVGVAVALGVGATYYGYGLLKWAQQAAKGTSSNVTAPGGTSSQEEDPMIKRAEAEMKRRILDGETLGPIKPPTTGLIQN